MGRPTARPIFTGFIADAEPDEDFSAAGVEHRPSGQKLVFAEICKNPTELVVT